MVVQRAAADQVQPAWRLKQNREEWEESTSLQVFPSHPRRVDQDQAGRSFTRPNYHLPMTSLSSGRHNGDGACSHTRRAR
jgi:hypothetical protein